MASDANATVKVFDANNSSQTQYSQLQDAITSGQYNGIILQPIFGTGLITSSAGDREGHQGRQHGPGPRPELSTDAPQVPGLAANVMFVPTQIGTKLGNLVVQACAVQEPEPVQRRLPVRHQGVGARRRDPDAFNKAIAADPAVKVVAQGQSFFTPTEGTRRGPDHAPGATPTST